ncbi:MAG: fibronectin type III domain-containing protein [Sedimentisphaerales bacterium]|nr:fibronectin type III domain-containing protein [Sedimentisphaerales bacterium]
MAVFPKTESSVYDLALQMMNGLNEHGDVYPSITPEAQMALATAIGTYNTARNTQANTQSIAKNATIAKNEKQDLLEEEMQKIIYLAEHDCMNDPGNLDYIGWSDRKTPTPLVKPSQPGELTPAYEGPGTLTLTWDKPASGGAVSSYRIERSDQPEGGGVPGPWTLITTSYSENVTMQNQPRGIEMQYRAIATNAAGDSMPSSIATVVL